MKTIKIAIADDHDLFREGLTSIISYMDNIEIVLQVSNGIELLEGLKTLSVDVILMDLEMEAMDGIEASEIVKKDYPDIKILVLTMYDEERMITYMMEAGVNGYLLKNTTKDELEDAIHSVFRKEFYFNDKVSKALLSSVKRKKPSRPSFDAAATLSKREQEVLELICQELTTNEIAEKLFLSHRTVEGHRTSLMQKLNVKNTVGLVIKAVREGIVMI